MISAAAFSLMLKILLTLALSGVALWAGWALAAFLRRGLQVQLKRTYAVELTNQGNVTCFYRLRAASPEPRLVFSWWKDGRPLPPIYEAQATPSAAAPAAAASTPSAVSSPEAGRTLTEGAAQAEKKSNALANFLAAVGNLLPGKAGQAAKDSSGQLRQANAKVRRAEAAPRTAQRRIEALSSASGQLGLQPVRTHGRAPAAEVGASQPGHTADFSPQGETAPPVRLAGLSPAEGWVQTPPLSPGEHLRLHLQVDKRGARYPTGSFPYTVEVQPEALVTDFGLAPLSRHVGAAYFPPVSAWRYWLPRAAQMTAWLAALVVYLAGLRFLWLTGS